MQRIASLGLAIFVGAWFPALAAGQITAQPARPFTPSPPASYPPVYPATYAPSYSNGPSVAAASPFSLGGAALLQSPEANQIRGWYRDYLGRDAGQDLSAMVNLLRGGMSAPDLQA